MAKILYTSGVLGEVCINGSEKWQKFSINVRKIAIILTTFDSDYDFYMVEFTMFYLVISTQTAKMTDNIFETNTPESALKVKAPRPRYMRPIS